ncbi:TPA: VOC family protein [Candidatus Woesearchaeota archaeon]|nr:VOC family protein [Candidatus Woesearchaeota archaeon]
MSDPVVHFEIPADNTARAKKFYEKTFGWKIDFLKGFDYFSIKTNGKHKGKDVGINGGMMQRHAPGQPLTFYITVDSVDAALKKAVANGAKVCLPKTPIGTMGAIALFVDTEGNTVGLHDMTKAPAKKTTAKKTTKKKR